MPLVLPFTPFLTPGISTIFSEYEQMKTVYILKNKSKIVLEEKKIPKQSPREGKLDEPTFASPTSCGRTHWAPNPQGL